ncbi:MAG: PEGA domain-containing protein [Patescibacteria group bacterium]
MQPYGYREKSNTVSSFLYYVLAVIGVGFLIYFGISIYQNYAKIKGKSALLVSVTTGSADVYVDNELLGQTPFESEEIVPGEHTVSIKSADVTYTVSVPFTANTQTVINRDLGVSSTFSSGQNFWLEPSADTDLSIISTPEKAKVYIDGVEVGETPYASSSLSDGDYDIKLEYPGYESFESRVKVLPGVKLNVAMSLFPKPTPSKVSLLEGSDSLYDLSTSNPAVNSDTNKWVDALLYWNSTRGINLSGEGTNTNLVFGYFLDYLGNVYDGDGNLVDPSNYSGLGKNASGAYLGKSPAGSGLTDEARVAFESLTSGTFSTSGSKAKTAKVLETGLGWLRVRDAAGLGGNEVGKATVGESYEVLEENSEWVKIKLSAEVSGWVSATYVNIEDPKTSSPSSGDTDATTKSTEQTGIFE